jgi:hypothetical protein
MKVDPSRVITAFSHGVHDKDMLGETRVYEPETVAILF